MTITSAEQAELDPLTVRLKAAQAMVGLMCAEGRPPRMSIPARWDYDEDLLICDSINAALTELERLREALDEQRAEVARMFKDTQRYQFLRDKAWGQYGALALLPPAEMDAAIDAAMREQAMQALVGQAQELNMGYGDQS